MEKLFLFIMTITAAVSYLSSGKCSVLSQAYTIESPQYIVVHLESDFEIRLYKEMSWMSAPVHGTNSFQNSTKQGFHRLYQYLQGANLNSTHFLMTRPVLTTIYPSHSGSSYIIRYHLPSEYIKTSPPPPSAELNLQLTKWKSHCIAVRKFTGYAMDDNIEKEKDALVSSIAKRLPNLMLRATDQTQYYNYSIAQYNASRHRTERINEVWMNVTGFAAEGCSV